MAVTHTAREGFRKIGDGDTNYGDDGRSNWAAMDYILNPANTFFVSPEFTEANLENENATSKRRFSTIQAAITAWEAGGFGDTHGGVILVGPGTYEERLAVTKSGHLQAVGGIVTLAGDATAASLIDFDAADGESHSLRITGFQLKNQAADAGSEVSTPMILLASDQGSGNYGSAYNDIVLDDCVLDLNDDNANAWLYALRVRGGNRCVMRNCRMEVPANTSGGEYVRFPLSAHGNTTTGKYARIVLEDTRIQHPGFTSPTSATIYMLENAQGRVSRCSFNRAFNNGVTLFDGSTPATNLLGLSDATAAAAYGNHLGVYDVEFF